MLGIIIAISVFLVFIIYYNFKKYFEIWQYIEKFPGPTPLPFIGNGLQLGLTPAEYLISILKLWRKYGGKMYRLWVARHYYILLSDPVDIEVVLSNTTLLYKSDLYDLFRPWLGDGLLTSFGPKWHKHRKMITSSFHFQILLDYLDTMNTTSNKFIEKLMAKAKDGRIFDIQPMIHNCTLDIICDTAMGVKINSLDDSDSDVVHSFNDICYVIQERVFSLVKRVEWLFPLTSDYWKQRRALNILKETMSEIIESRREIIKNVDTNENSSEEIFVRSKKAFLDNLLTATIDGRALNFTEIFEEVSTFMFEGHDTTASGIAFTVFTLSRHPYIQEKVYEEQKLIFGTDMKRNPTYQELQDMKYLELIIKETLRLYPSVPVIARTNTELIELNGKQVPPYTTITMLLIAMGYNEKYFPNPCKFDPERMNAENREGKNPFDNVPFSAGPRNCIGQKFAMMELKSVISNIVRNFEILPPEDGLASGIRDISQPNSKPQSKYDPILAAAVTLKSENGIMIRLKKR